MCHDLVKSLRAVSVPKSNIDSMGLFNDRRFMFVRPTADSATTIPTPMNDNTPPTHRFLTQRQAPILAQITASLPTDDHKMTLTHEPTKTSITINTSDAHILSQPQRYFAGIWEDSVEVADMGDEAAKFIQTILQSPNQPPKEPIQQPNNAEDGNNDGGGEEKSDEREDSISFGNVRLVAQLPTFNRYTNDEYIPLHGFDTPTGNSPAVSLTDGFPILIATEASLHELNTLLLAKNKNPIQMNRFRPNIVISGNQIKPFEEDQWKSIMIGNVLFHIVKACPRCKQSCTDQMTGQRFEEPLATLQEVRKCKEDGVDAYFAMNAIVGDKVGGVGDPNEILKSIKVGDKVRILTKGIPVWGEDADPGDDVEEEEEEEDEEEKEEMEGDENMDTGEIGTDN